MTQTYTPGELPEDTLGLTQERFGFTLFMSICVHAVLILGVGFTIATQPRVSESLDITLATFQSEEAPDDADFLAQANQQGSGSEAEALAPATDTQARFSDTVIHDVSDFLTERPTQTEQKRIIARASDSGAQSELTETPTPPVATPPDLRNLSPDQMTDAISSLQAQLDLHRQAYAKRPRRYTMTSASTKQDADVLYLDDWRKRIEVIGNLNYPQDASAAGIYGTLRLMVSLKPDGTVHDIRILRSSGERILDDAAVSIVKLAAPFEPFPLDMRSRVDILEIIRTWQFHRGDTFSSF
ncbi:MAG: energy transducer TonB [Pseudohongiellaceae bacterium]